MENIYNILQWSASSHPEHAQGYLEQHLQKCDVCVMERCTQHHLDTITQHFPHVHKKKQFENRYLISISKLDYVWVIRAPDLLYLSTIQ